MNARGCEYMGDTLSDASAFIFVLANCITRHMAHVAKMTGVKYLA